MFVAGLLRARWKVPIRSMSTFQALGLNPHLCEALQAKGLKVPTDIQERTIAAALKGADVICTDATGSGKTLAYLLPVLEQIRRAETRRLADDSTAFRREVSRPKAIVLVPSRELGIQVGTVARELSHHAKFSSCVITGGSEHKPQKTALARPIDLLVATPGRLAKYLKSGHVFISRVEYVILDEADTLLDRKMGFRSVVDEILGPIRASGAASGRHIQYLLAAATVKPPMDQVFAAAFPNLKLVSGKTVHQTPSSLTEEHIRVPGTEGKHGALRASLSQWGKAKAVVFCNSTASCRSTDHMLQEHCYASTTLHGDIPPVVRKQNFEAFVSGKATILVCTDLAARGLDFADVDHVINFDFPKSLVDYLHRAGRTGRAGKRGVVTNLVTKHDAATARAMAMAKGKHRPLLDVADVATNLPAFKDPDSARQGADAKPSQAKSTQQSRRFRGTHKLKAHKVRTWRKA
ncbi:hypothetical protein LEN26_001047 [Aphanomyces euteiches]|nr:hypothetical protein AeMF1_001014 [Aphanomyces euteiches]KAH9162203.1 hypothetical protein LEN26_001047 [Aphanomyces euteiches]KAH9196331.1 hypothetical protein AeNC1_001685 [Aphanomyces euteiches]